MPPFLILQLLTKPSLNTQTFSSPGTCRLCALCGIYAASQSHQLSVLLKANSASRAQHWAGGEGQIEPETPKGFLSQWKNLQWIAVWTFDGLLYEVLCLYYFITNKLRLQGQSHSQSKQNEGLSNARRTHILPSLSIFLPLPMKTLLLVFCEDGGKQSEHVGGYWPYFNMWFPSSFRKSKQIQTVLQSTNTFKSQGATW